MEKTKFIARLDLLEDKMLASRLRFLTDRGIAQSEYAQNVYDRFYKIKEIIDEYFEYNGRYPTVTEFAKISKERKFLSNKYIDRVYGGMKNVRRMLGMEIIDFTTGTTGGKHCIAINKRGQEKELEVYKLLCNKFGEEFVHKEHTPLDDRRIRVDFYVYTRYGRFFVDVFYPEDMQSMSGCLGNKIKKYVGNSMNEYPIIFLMTNENISRERIAKFLKARKIPFGNNQTFMTLDQFKEFIKTKKALKAR